MATGPRGAETPVPYLNIDWGAPATVFVQTPSLHIAVRGAHFGVRWGHPSS